MAAADPDEVARARIHRQPRLDREEPVVALDQVVHLVEASGVPRRCATRARTPRGRCLVRQREPLVGELALVLVGQTLDLAEPLHVRQRAAERTDVACDVRPEVPQDAAERPALERAVGEVFAEEAVGGLRARGPLVHAALLHDALALAAVHAVVLPARVPVDAPDPLLEPRIAAVEREVLDQDAVERLVVGRVEDQPVLQEREGDCVERGELVAEQVGPTGEERLEQVARSSQLLDPLRRPSGRPARLRAGSGDASTRG